MMLIRKLLEFVFTQKELSALDDLLPGSKVTNNNNRATANAGGANKKLLDNNDSKA